MKTLRIFSLVSIALIGLAQPIWAGPRGGGGGFGGGGRSGGGHFGGGGIRAAPAFSGGGTRFSGANLGGFRSGGFRAAAALRSSSSYFTGRSVGGANRAPRFYYGRGGMPAVRSGGFTASPNRSLTPNAREASTTNVRGTPTISSRQNRADSLTRQNTRVSNSQVAASNRQPNRKGSVAGRNAVSNRRSSTTANRESFLKNHAFARHDGNWHRDWDKGRAHFDHDRVFVFVNGFWWGLYPWDYYPYYAYSYPYDYYGYPYDYYYGDPNGYYNDYPYSDDNQLAYGASDQSAGNATVSAVQSELGKLGYYGGAVDGVLGDQTEAALARYQEDRDLSVTATVDAATLQSLGIR
jgi:Putative peptidoglycan binding domain